MEYSHILLIESSEEHRKSKKWPPECQLCGLPFDMPGGLWYASGRTAAESDMRKLLLLVVSALGLAVLAPAPLCAKGDNAPSANLDRAFRAEITALTEAETMLKTISDEKSAKTVKAKLMHKFSLLRPILHGTVPQLEELARAQNRVSAIMWDMTKQPYFESQNMQELWTVMTHHFSRRSANRK